MVPDLDPDWENTSLIGREVLVEPAEVDVCDSTMEDQLKLSDDPKIARELAVTNCDCEGDGRCCDASEVMDAILVVVSDVVLDLVLGGVTSR